MNRPYRWRWRLLALLASLPLSSRADPLLERTRPPDGEVRAGGGSNLPARSAAPEPGREVAELAAAEQTLAARQAEWQALGRAVPDEPRLNRERRAGLERALGEATAEVARLRLAQAARTGGPPAWGQREPSLTSAARRLLTDGESGRWVARLAASADPLGEALGWGLGLALLLGGVVQLAARRGRPRVAGETLRQRVGVALACSGVRHAGAAAGLLALAWAVQPGELLPATSRAPLVVVEALLGWLGVRWLLQAILSPGPPATPLVSWEPLLARRLARRASLLVLLLLTAGLLQHLQQPLEIPAALVWCLRATCGGLLLPVWWSLDRLLAPVLTPPVRAWRWLPRILVLAAVLAEAAGWRQMAAHLLVAVLGGVLWLPLLGLLRRLGEEGLDQLDRGTAGWTQPWRTWLGVGPAERLPGGSWLHLALQTGVALAGVLGFLRLVLPPPVYESVLTRADAGWRLGNLPLSPLKMALGLLVLALLLAAASWLRAILARRWRAHGRWEAAALEAALTVSSHAAQLVAVTTALAVAGLDLSKLTVVVGALSVGLGFGLQNIVSNLMAGLILLFERRIRIGDQIRVGDAEGVVAALAVRSTELRLADGTRVILPNSDLITKPVLNYGPPLAELAAPGPEAAQEGGE